MKQLRSLKSGVTSGPRWIRLAILIAAGWTLHWSSREFSPAIESTPSLEVLRKFFPEGHHVRQNDGPLGGFEVRSKLDNFIGSVVVTSPESDDLVGYSGPSNTLIAFNADGAIIGTKLLESRETEAHVDAVRSSPVFWKQLIGWNPARSPLPNIEGVAGSTLTSQAIVEGIERRLTGNKQSRRFPQPIELSEAKLYFTDAAAIELDRFHSEWYRILDNKKNHLGYLLRSSPDSDNVRGYQGPSESLIAIDKTGTKLLSVGLRSSFDTPDYVDRVKNEERFLETLNGRELDSIATIDFQKEGIEGVSGATQTSYALVEGIRRRIERETKIAATSAKGRHRILHQLTLLAIFIGGLATSFTSLRSNRQWRWVWQLALIAILGLWLGDLISIGLLAGWSRHGISLNTAPILLIVVATALLLPMTSRKNLYCQHLCPHGALQDWLGRFPSLHIRLPETIRRYGSRGPQLLLAIGFLLAVFVPSFNLANLEPFDSWILGTGALISLVIAIVGLIASLFVPQAYCRFGCPTGALLKLVASGGDRDRLLARDWSALVLVGVSMFAIYIMQASSNGLAIDSTENSKTASTPSPVTRLLESETSKIEWHGTGFGTTWSIRFRKSFEGESELQQSAEAELKRIETSLSHWHPDSETSQFNQSQTTLEMDASDELLALISKAERLSEMTRGAYDITVGPLVNAWGFGPSGKPTKAPSDEELEKLLASVGGRKLQIDRKAGTIRKLHPDLQIDLGSLLQGYAADQVASILKKRLPSDAEFLIDVGGELLASGKWSIGIENPEKPSAILQQIELKDEAIATSGLYRSKQKIGDRMVHHFISPTTGRPYESELTLCSIRSKTCMEADGLATACMLIPISKLKELANQESFDFWAVDSKGLFFDKSR